MSAQICPPELRFDILYCVSTTEKKKKKKKGGVREIENESKIERKRDAETSDRFF